MRGRKYSIQVRTLHEVIDNEVGDEEKADAILRALSEELHEGDGALPLSEQITDGVMAPIEWVAEGACALVGVVAHITIGIPFAALLRWWWGRTENGE